MARGFLMTKVQKSLLLYFNLLIYCFGLQFAVASELDATRQSLPWWKTAVFYEIYIKSFKDTTGDGVGDINGITEKLDYLQNLGVDAILLTPHYDSPGKDSGYDVSDYRRVMKEYGNNHDFDVLVSELKKRNMRIMIDVVVNHTSEEHPWFIESMKSKDNPYRDFYIWRDGVNGGPPTDNNSSFGGSSWEESKQTSQYYYHTFASSQPDLNWDNPRVRDAVYEDILFWLDKGVSGLRFDAVADFVKPYDTKAQFEKFKSDTVEKVVDPKVHSYIKDMHENLFAGRDLATIAEVWRTPPEEIQLFTNPSNKEFNLAFIFDAIFIGRRSVWEAKEWSIPEFKRAISNVDRITGSNGWGAFFLSNHDNARVVSHFGNDSAEWRDSSSKALALLSLTQRGTPFIYQGDEIGMTNYPFKDINDFDDIQLKGYWRDLVETGTIDREYFLNNARQTNRDNGRTPFQWDSSTSGGFTTGTPWISVNPNYISINAGSQVNEPKSVFNFYRKLIKLRKSNPALVVGEYRDLDPSHDQVFAYTRTLGTESFLIVINMTDYQVKYSLPNKLNRGKLILQNLPDQSSNSSLEFIDLKPWQASIYKLD